MYKIMQRYTMIIPHKKWLNCHTWLFLRHYFYIHQVLKQYNVALLAYGVPAVSFFLLYHSFFIMPPKPVASAANNNSFPVLKYVLFELFLYLSPLYRDF